MIFALQTLRLLFSGLLRWLRESVTAIFLMLPFLSLSHAEDVYRVGVEDIEYYPIQDYRGEEKHGIIAEILNEFAKQEGIRFEFIPLPIHRFNSWYHDNAIDFRVPDHPSWTQSQDPHLIFSGPVLSLCEATIVLSKNATMPMQEFDRLGTMFGFTPSAKWKDYLAQGKLQLISDPSMKVLTRMLLKEMVDGLDVDMSVVQHQLSLLNLPTETVTFAQKVPHTTLNYRMSTINHSDIIKRFDAFMANKQTVVDGIAAHYPLVRTHACGNIVPQGLATGK